MASDVNTNRYCNNPNSSTASLVVSIYTIKSLTELEVLNGANRQLSKRAIFTVNRQKSSYC